MSRKSIIASFPCEVAGEKQVWRITAYLGETDYCRVFGTYPSRRKDGKHNKWTHAIGGSGNGYHNWEVFTRDGINPCHQGEVHYFKSQEECREWVEKQSPN